MSELNRLAANTRKQNLKVLDNIPVRLEAGRVRPWLSGMTRNPRFEGVLEELLTLAGGVARAKAVFRVCLVEHSSADGIAISGTIFRGSMLQVNLREGMQVYPFVASCGKEIDSVELGPRDILKKYILEFIKMDLLISAINFTQQFILQEQGLKQLSSMNPGELESWPITEQKPLFCLLRGVERAIGVRLTENLGMLPLKSRSGIFFPSETKFENCQFCARQRCVGRRAAFDPELAAKFKTRAKGMCG
jgi:hypothetical protein